MSLSKGLQRSQSNLPTGKANGKNWENQFQAQLVLSYLSTGSQELYDIATELDGDPDLAAQHQRTIRSWLDQYQVVAAVQLEYENLEQRWVACTREASAQNISHFDHDDSPALIAEMDSLLTKSSSLTRKEIKTLSRTSS